MSHEKSITESTATINKTMHKNRFWYQQTSCKITQSNKKKDHFTFNKCCYLKQLV